MKIFVGRFGHEANTFSSELTDFKTFKDLSHWVRGEIIKEMFPGTPTFMGGILDIGNKYGVDMYPSSCCECAAPTLSRQCVDDAMTEILEDLNNAKNGLDGICFMLHGAGVAEGIPDLESYVLRKFRAIVGDEMPICVPLDLHGNITQEMGQLATLFGIKHYPHVDCDKASMLAMETCVESIKRGASPKTAIVSIPLLISCAAGYTFAEPFVSIQKFFDEYKKENNLIDITLFHGFPFADTPFTSASVVVVAWDDPQKHAEKLAEYVWERRSEFVAESLMPDQALDLAEAVKEPGYIVINELSDNPGAGTPGDGTHLLREMLKRNLPKSIYGYMYDQEAVEQICSHGIGDKVSFMLGGKVNSLHGEPVCIENAEILAMSNGEYISSSPMFTGVPFTIGKCARVKTGNVEIVIGSMLHQSFDDHPIRVTGADIEQYRYVGLKSAHHFRAYFEGRAAAIIPTDPPGLACCNFNQYEYKNVKRPIYPLDKDVTFKI